MPLTYRIHSSCWFILAACGSGLEFGVETRAEGGGGGGNLSDETGPIWRFAIYDLGFDLMQKLVRRLRACHAAKAFFG